MAFCIPSVRDRTVSNNRAIPAAMPADETLEERRSQDAEALRALPAASKLGRLSFDVLSRQAEGRVLFAGREFVIKRAAAHGVTRDDATTKQGNVLDIMERGAETQAERRLLCLLGAIGFDAETREDAQVQKTVAHAAWLQSATEFAWLDALVDACEGPLRAQVIGEIAQRAVDLGGGGARNEPSARALAVVCLAALAHANDAGARTHLASLAANTSLDAVLRASADALVPQASSDQRVEGSMLPVRTTGWRRVLTYVSGWALVRALGRGAFALAGREVRMTASLVGKELHFEEKGSLLGGATTSKRVSLPVTALLSVTREAKNASAPLIIGGLALAGGLLVGGTFLFDGLRSGELVLASVGAALALGGIVLDVLAEVWRRRSGAAFTLEFVLPKNQAMRLRVENGSEADAFVHAIRARLR